MSMLTPEDGYTDRSVRYAHTSNFIGGRWLPADSPARAPIIDCYTEETMGSAPISSTEDVDRAVGAAEGARPAVRAMHREERADVLERLRDEIDVRSEELAAIWARQAGMPIAVGRSAVTALPKATLSSLSALLRSQDDTETIGTTVVVREPVGVVAAITPWNYPFSQALIKGATALAAGCPVVVKPSELAPTSAFVLAEMVEKLGLPDGAFNVVAGNGRGTGEALVRHLGVDAVSFTGSTATGRRIMELASERVKRVALELGGKSAMVVADRASLEAAVGETMASCLRNNGQTCTSLTRLLVPKSLVADAADLAADIAAKQILGDPLDEKTTVGPLASAAQWLRVREFIQSGIEEGAQLVTGGLDRPGVSGFFVSPTVFSHVQPSMRIAQYEIFGPVLSIIGFEDLDDAIAIANGTEYGLAAAVRASDHDRAVALARRLQAGTVSVNGGVFNAEAPYGGVKQSGLGRELGRWGVDEFVEWKAMHLPGR